MAAAVTVQVLALALLSLLASPVSAGYARVQMPAALLAGYLSGRPPRRTAVVWTALALVCSWSAAGMLWHAPCDGVVVRGGTELATWLAPFDDNCTGINDALRVVTNVLSALLVVFLLHLCVRVLGDALDKPAVPNTGGPTRVVVAPTLTAAVLSLTFRGRPKPVAAPRAAPLAARTTHVLFALLAILGLRPAMHFAVAPTSPWPMAAAYAYGLHAGGKVRRAVYCAPVLLAVAWATLGDCGADALAFATEQRRDNCTHEITAWRVVVALLLVATGQHAWATLRDGRAA